MFNRVVPHKGGGKGSSAAGALQLGLMNNRNGQTSNKQASKQTNRVSRPRAGRSGVILLLAQPSILEFNVISDNLRAKEVLALCPLCAPGNSALGFSPQGVVGYRDRTREYNDSRAHD